MKLCSGLALAGHVAVLDARSGTELWTLRNTVTAAGRELVMDFLKQVAVDGIKFLAIEVPAATEVLRVAAVSVTEVSLTETRYEFYLDEAQLASETLAVFKLMADAATLVLDTGTTYAQVAPGLAKGPNQSLLILWTVRC